MFSDTPVTTIKKAEREDYQLDLGNMELCKLGNYADELIKKDDIWYKKEYIDKIIINENTSEIKWQESEQRFIYTIPDMIMQSAKNNSMSNRFTYSSATIENDNFQISQSNVLIFKLDKYTDVDKLKTYLKDNNIELIFYTILNEPKLIKIEEKTLINQLENLSSNAKTYSIETNIIAIAQNGVIPTIRATALIKN